MGNRTIFGWLLMASPLFLKYLSACCIVNGQVCGRSLPRSCWERLDYELDNPNILYTCRKGEEPVVLTECAAGCKRDQQNTDGDMCLAGAAEDIATTRMTTVQERRTRTEQPKTSGFLVIAQGGSLWRLSVEDNGDTEQLTNIPGEHNHAVAVDCVTRHLYWAVRRKGIRRSRYDGSYNHLVIIANDTIANGLAVDFVARNVFWVQGSAILVAKMNHLEAGHKTILSDTRIDHFTPLAVHPSRGSIYWSYRFKIETASMDGSNRRVLVARVWAQTLALDHEANDLYWADFRTGDIECISLNGEGERIVSVEGSKGHLLHGLSLSGGRVYWTSLLTGNVTSITKSGSTIKQHSLPAGRSGYLEGIVFVAEQCPKSNNLCAVSNGGCLFICLPLPDNNRKCVCPDGNSSCTS
ncbi:putative Nidogen-1 [Hypsibius exemplaris]|uniref:Nidogen-1 n=1 Tax=Hypsibius exemplaris TaxID=2072580 RepID=A0A1W0WW50_HYPEX|nr:putative Nidogen-1 [Hypsibius exemplaris]